MSSPITTGANLYRSKRILTPADIRGLNTTPVLLAPAMPGKTLAVAAWFQKYRFGTEAYSFSGLAYSYYGDVNVGIDVIDSELLSTINNLSASHLYNFASQIHLDAAPPDAFEGLGIYLVATGGNFDAGKALSATVNVPGLLYALNDTGNISDGDGTAVYTVTGVGGGGAVTTVSVTGGNGVEVGTGFATSVLTGSGDGNLTLNITAIRPQGDGTLEIDVLYQPI